MENNTTPEPDGMDHYSLSPRCCMWLIIIAVVIFLALLWPWSCSARNKAEEAATKANLHTIQISLESYAEDNEGAYPESVYILLSTGFLDYLPKNGFNDNHIKDIPFGSPDYEGEFTYIPVKEGNVVTGYYLLAYGELDSPGRDVNDDGEPDHVILVLSSGSSEGIELEEEYPLEELLNDAGEQSENQEE